MTQEEKREKQNAASRAWKKKHPDRVLAYVREYRKRPGYKKRYLEWKRKRWAAMTDAERKAVLTLRAMTQADIQRRQRERMERDPEYYAMMRERNRLYAAAYRRRKGITKKTTPYMGRASTRIPDWAVKGQVIMDRRSVFLAGNLDADRRKANELEAKIIRRGI